MFQNSVPVSFLTDKQEAQFLASLESKPMHKLAALLMTDCGLRVSECLSLLFQDFDFQRRELKIKSLKKRASEKKKIRIVPLTKRVYEAAIEWWTKSEVKELSQKVFTITRQQFHRYFKAKSDGLVHPHLLRHTCATKLIENGAEIHVVKDLLGHSDSRTTEIYIHASEERKRTAIRAIERESWFEKMKNKLIPQKSVSITPLSIGANKFHVGRVSEMQKIIDLYEKKVNTLIIAPQGMGKSHLLDNLQIEKALRVDDCKGFQKTLENMIIKLMNEDKEAIAELLKLNPSVITRASLKRLIEMLAQITEKHEYTIIFDDVTQLTPTAVNALEKLRNHFHIIAAARSVEVKNASWLTNFEKIELGKLNRVETIELTVKLSADYREQIEDFETFKNHIWVQTQGIPEFVCELCERYRKEKFVSIESISTIRHTAARKEIDASTFILLLFGSLVILKFWAKEAMQDDKEAFMIFGAIGMLVVMFGRFAFRGLKRRFV